MTTSSSAEDSTFFSPENIETDDNRWAYYSVLMVDKNATTAEINAAYKRLSLQFHPDKHLTAAARKAAENLFNRIKRARDVLCDDHLRRIYDAIGPDGLEEFENSQLVSKTMKSSGEIIEEYERLLKIKHFQDELNSYNPNATTQVHLDMCSVFESGYFDQEVDEEITILDQLSYVDVTAMKLDQGFTIPFDQQNDISVGSSLQVNFAQRRQIAGGMSAHWRRLFPFGISANFGVVMGATSQLSCNASKQLFKHGTASVAASCDLIQDTLMFGASCSYNHQLSKRVRAEISANTGLGETVKCSTIYNGDSYSILFSAQTGMAFMETSPSPHCLQLKFSKYIASQDLRCKLHTLVSFSKYQLSMAVSQNIPSRQIHWSTRLLLDTSNGVNFSLTVRRGRQKYIFPIQMAGEVQVTATAYGILLPALVYGAIKSIFLVPYLKKQRELHLAKKKEEEKENVERRRLEALEEVELMREQAQRIVAVEESRSGLLIVKALYGKVHQVSDSLQNNDECVINVTVALQHQVKDSALSIRADVSKVSMPGFYDPCFGEEKSLYVRYKFHGRLHHVTISDSQPISIPKQGHLISGS